jgi:hypothetical protein
VCGVRRSRDGGASRKRRARDAHDGRDCGPYRLLDEGDEQTGTTGVPPVESGKVERWKSAWRGIAV